MASSTHSSGSALLSVDTSEKPPKVVRYLWDWTQLSQHPMFPRWARFPVWVALVLCLSSCNASTTTGLTVPVASLDLSPSSGLVWVGKTLKLTATPIDSSGNSLSGGEITWSSSDSSVATVNKNGLVTGVGVVWLGGSVTITADCEGQSAAATLIVMPELEFVLVPAGHFQMGSTNGDPDELPVHTVNITKPFYLQKTEVTQAQWRALMGSNPSHFYNCGDACPVEQVTRSDVQEFISRLAVVDPGRNYRLPTEAEWEYAARAGKSADYGGTGDLAQMGWYGGNSGSLTHPVAKKRANGWGLYDMHGNVWEWVQDLYSSSYYSQSPADDPTGPSSSGLPVLRGGSWSSDASSARSANRYSVDPRRRNSNYGFRLVALPLDTP